MRFTLPNILTLFRFALIPIFIWTFFSIGTIVALAIFVIACITDILDGWIARKTNTESSFGRWADPLADKAMTITVLACLTAEGNLPWYFMAFYVTKEILMITGGIVMYIVRKIKKIYKAKPIGKLAINATFCGIVSSFFGELIAPWHIVAMWVAVGMNIASMAYYYLYCYKERVES